MPKIKRMDSKYEQASGRTAYTFKCPGCRQDHIVGTAGREPVWSFNGSEETPTFSPSLRVRWSYDEKQLVCHSFVTNGQIQFLDDCTHDLRGQTVELAEVANA